jgi:hypothetical protein
MSLRFTMEAEAVEGVGSRVSVMKRRPSKQARARLTIVADSALLALARTAVRQTKGLTFTKLIDTGLRLIIARLERQRGRRFRPMMGRLPAGRPRKLKRPRGAAHEER